MEINANTNTVVIDWVHSFRNLLSHRQFVLWQYILACIGSTGILSRPYQSFKPSVIVAIPVAFDDNSLILSSVGR